MRAIEMILSHLRSVISELSADGGQVSGSIYDTAQVLRLAPPDASLERATEWLLSQQQGDGGWGNPAAPRSRDAPTLAVLLLLHSTDPGGRSRDVLAAGLEFLRRQSDYWTKLPDDLPVGVELTLPRLLDEAAEAGLQVPQVQYEGLRQLGQKRRKMLEKIPLLRGTPPVHSWESWGKEPTPAFLDASGGIGHSPSATAAWLKAAAQRSDLDEPRARARQYLLQAQDATALGIPGVVPTVWPIARFEQCWALFSVMCAGLLSHPGLQDVLRPQLEQLFKAVGERGLGMSDAFLADGDDTAAALAVLHLAGLPVDLKVLQHFVKGDEFVSYPGELQPSITTTSHGAQALWLAGRDVTANRRFIIKSQHSDGRWLVDKWHSSWLYATSQAMLALGFDAAEPLAAAVQALLRHQHPDGGWGAGEHATTVETAFAAISLHAIREQPYAGEAAQRALRRARDFLVRHYTPLAPCKPLWIGKELYAPFRIDRAFELSALAALMAQP